ncbi:MAG: hypothetical protein HOQ45_20085 [Nocardioidaceae bacterium]|nr:hypothetical protein [Nocardioidaceae bacterium]
MTEQQAERKIDVSWPQVVASALAAVSSAVLLSTVGVVGTLIGAAVGSVVATVGTAIYRYFLEASRTRVAAAQSAALARVARAKAHANVARHEDRHDTVSKRRLENAENELEDAENELQSAGTDETRPSWREALAALPWKWVALVAGGVFLIAMLVILGFELATGRAVSTYTGGTDGSERTTFSGLAGGGGGGTSDQQAPSGGQPGSGASDQPSGQPAQQGTGGAAEPSAEPSGQPSADTSEEPSGGPTPTPTETAPTSGAPGPVTQAPEVTPSP